VLFDEAGAHPLPAASKRDAAVRLLSEIATRYRARRR